MIVNLVVNARDAMPGGGGITIETSNVDVDADSPLLAEEGAEPGVYAMLAVRDTGVGMAPATRAQLFEPFFTTKERRQGHGARARDGLRDRAAERRLPFGVERSGTRVDLHHLSPAPRVAAGPGVDAAAPAEPLPGRERVLLVEDEPVVRRLVRRMLERNGYDVFEAGTVQPPSSTPASSTHRSTSSSPTS